MEHNLGKIIAEEIKKKYNKNIDVAIILGSGLKAFKNNFKTIAEIDYSSVSGIPVPSTKGQTGKFVIAKYEDKTILLMLGRFHLYEGNSPLACTSLVWCLKYLGVKNLILTTACGGINKKFKPSDLMVINDQINFTQVSPITQVIQFEQDEKFISMHNAYDKGFINSINDIAKQNKIKVFNGTFMQVIGPQYETPAEIEAYRKLGADAISMSTAIETIMARFLNIKVLGLCCITNKTGKDAKMLTHEEVLKNADIALKNISILLLNFIKNL